MHKKISHSTISYEFSTFFDFIYLFYLSTPIMRDQNRLNLPPLAPIHRLLPPLLLHQQRLELAPQLLVHHRHPPLLPHQELLELAPYALFHRCFPSCLPSASGGRRHQRQLCDADAVCKAQPCVRVCSWAGPGGDGSGGHVCGAWRWGEVWMSGFGGGVGCRSCCC